MYFLASSSSLAISVSDSLGATGFRRRRPLRRRTLRRRALPDYVLSHRVLLQRIHCSRILHVA